MISSRPRVSKSTTYCLANRFLHSTQAKGFSAEWARLCRLRCSERVKTLSQTSHFISCISISSLSPESCSDVITASIPTTRLSCGAMVDTKANRRWLVKKLVAVTIPTNASNGILGWRLPKARCSIRASGATYCGKQVFNKVWTIWQRCVQKREGWRACSTSKTSVVLLRNSCS